MKNIEDKRDLRRSRCDIREETDSIIMRLEMPGVNKSGLNINIEGDKLIIDGQRIEDTKKGDWLVHEIRPGNFSMEYTIDKTIDRGNIEAALSQGVLTLTLGLSESVKPRKIEVISK
ncbi:MAG: Hsp20/alpha crystallin family protein [Spirochaetaceae bacterium]|nr:Hsp20/alpha crystallin family protein [Spirochaetaceae bacterium]RKX72785.1 MAG: Hsp20/alpha crystallin family protein [Spirochaetota bacterium]RKX83060.1 MAG: Hsp20/alpha crystallin family protein [Spirochaetota bacterium]